MSISTRMRLAMGLAVWLSPVLSACCLAASGGSVTLPLYNQKRVKNGIIADVDCRWTNGMGYRPVHVTLTTGRTKRDRTIRVVVLPDSWRSTHEPLAVSADVTIPEGEKRVTQTVLVPQYSLWNSIRVTFYEDGRKLKDLSMEQPYSWNNRYSNLEAPCLLLLDSKAPGRNADRDGLVRRIRNEDSKTLPDAEKFQFLTSEYFQRTNQITDQFFEQRGRSSDADSLTFIKDTPTIEMLPPAELPTSYVGLTGIDLIVISVSDLAALADADPTRFQAVDFFVRNGGNMVVYDGQEATRKTANLLDASLDWKQPDQVNYPAVVAKNLEELYRDQPAPAGATRRKQLGIDVPAFALASHGLGRLLAIESADPYTESVGYWQWIVNSLGLDGLTWTMRQGVSYSQSNDDYWDFLIPGFGSSPVESFLAVITIFILLIGPANYYLLNRIKRLYLLPVTVGLAAFITTVAMIGYAIVNDGMTTHVRLWSFTKLDQRSKQNIAATHCRQSYFAAISPRGGLTYPSHTAVYPVLPIPDRSLEREEFVQDRTQSRVLGRGYMRTRTTMQFLTTNVETTDQCLSLEVQVHEDQTGRQAERVTRATNKMDVELTHVWIRDAQGELWQALGTAPGQVLELGPSENKAAQLVYLKLAGEHRPSAPPGLDKHANDFMFATSGMSNYYGRPVNIDASILKSRLSALSDTSQPSFFSRPRPNTYLAVSRQAPAFVHQGTNATEEAGFHVIQGSW